MSPGSHPPPTLGRVRETVDAIYRSDSCRILATLIRLLGDFDLAEEALHDAFAAAVERWPIEGPPGNPRPWLLSTGRFKAIDAMRRRARFDRSLGERAERLQAGARSGRRDRHLHPISKAGPSIELRAEMDLIVAIPACSSPGCNAGAHKPG